MTLYTIPPIKVVGRFQTSDGEFFQERSSAEFHQEQIAKAEYATNLLEEGFSVGECLRRAEWLAIGIDPILDDITINSKLSIPHWQCRDEPGYSPTHFTSSREIHLFGDAGSWSGCYGNNVTLRDLARYAQDKNSQLGPL